MQLQKQSLSFVKHCFNNEELNLVKCAFSEKPYSLESLIDVLSKWRWMLGINSNNQSEDDLAKELILLAQFVSTNYKSINIEELNLAIDLSLTDRLECDVRTFNAFSPMYISRVLNAYLQYKRNIIREIAERKQKDDLKEIEKKELTPREKMDAMIDLIKYLYDDYKKNDVVNDYFNTLYNYFRRTNRIKPTKDNIDNAIKNAKIETNKHINSYFANALKEEKPNKDYLEKRFARNYCVKLYFDEIDLDNLISSISIKEFE